LYSPFAHTTRLVIAVCRYILRRSGEAEEKYETRRTRNVV